MQNYNPLSEYSDFIYNITVILWLYEYNVMKSINGAVEKPHFLTNSLAA